MEVARLRRLVVSGATGILNERKPPAEGEGTDPASYALEMELQLAKEALTSKLNLTIMLRTDCLLYLLQHLRLTKGD